MAVNISKSIPEIIVLAVIILLVAVYSFVFLADGFVFVKIIADSQNTAPDKDFVVVKIEQYKRTNKKYPPELERVGLSRQYGTVYLAYTSDDNRFELCYRFFPYLGAMVDCYDSDVGRWSLR